MAGALDYGGKARILGTRVDMGAMESGASAEDQDDDGMPDWWEELHFGSATGAEAGGDPDGDLLNNLGEYLFGTDPNERDTDGDGSSDWDESRAGTQGTNAGSYLGLLPCGTGEGGAVVVRWRSEPGKSYRLARSTNLAADGFGWKVGSNLAATVPVNACTDAAAPGPGRYYYRVELEE